MGVANRNPGLQNEAGYQKANHLLDDVTIGGKNVARPLIAYNSVGEFDVSRY
jgi:hypothetical protein